MVKRQGFKCSYSMLSLVAVLWTLAEYRESSLYLEDMDAREILEFCSFYVFFFNFWFCYRTSSYSSKLSKEAVLCLVEGLSKSINRVIFFISQSRGSNSSRKNRSDSGTTLVRGSARRLREDK